jgi:hypothetical protein
MPRPSRIGLHPWRRKRSSSSCEEPDDALGFRVVQERFSSPAQFSIILHNNLAARSVLDVIAGTICGAGTV